MRAIIYGLGKGYQDFFGMNGFVQCEFRNQGIEVIGFSDSRMALWGNEIFYNGQRFTVRSISDFQNETVDRIIVTTKKYFSEIREEWMEKGYTSKQFSLIDELYESYLDRIFETPVFTGKTGIEIGGPTELFQRIYEKCLSCDNVNFSENTVWWEKKSDQFCFQGRVLGKVWILDATDMGCIKDNEYDFVLSSNNLEHIANPLKALKEFIRVVKPGGMAVVVVPKKEETFDHNREYTSFEHLTEDYMNDITEDDLSHLPEIIEKHDYDMDIACGGKEKFIERAKRNIENRCLHHHVFDEICLQKSFEFSGLKVGKVVPIKGNWLIIGKKGG